jgi:hypothetical protein
MKIVLPDAVIELVRVELDRADVSQWHIGDMLVSIVEELGILYERSGVRSARAAIIRELATRTGRDASTLRDRHLMAAFYPPEVRASYDALTYHQLRACKSAGDNWRQYADWALDNLPAPVALIRARIKHNGDTPPLWLTRFERLIDQAQSLIETPETPIPIVQLTTSFISAAEAAAKDWVIRSAE